MSRNVMNVLDGIIKHMFMRFFPEICRIMRSCEAILFFYNVTVHCDILPPS